MQTNQLDVAIIRAPLLRYLTIAISPLYLRENGAGTALANTPGHVIRTDTFIREGRKVDLAALIHQGGAGNNTSMRACNGAGFSRRWCRMPLTCPPSSALSRRDLAQRSLPASARAVCVGNVVYVDIIDRLRESELTLVCHRIIRSEVLKNSSPPLLRVDARRPAAALFAQRERSPCPDCF